MTILESLPPMRAHGAVEISHGPLDDAELYGRLLADAPATGRCPVLLSGRALSSLRHGWDPVPAVRELERRDAAVVLAGRYPGGCILHDGCLAPYGETFPGLAPGATGTALTPDDVVATAVEEAALVDNDLLGVVPVGRPADIPAAVGWFGMATRWDDVVGMSAVLRSWEERFGAVLVRMDRTTLELAVTVPPWTEEECLAVAAEHLAFCHDLFAGNPGTLRSYAAGLRGARWWRFWWD